MMTTLLLITLGLALGDLPDGFNPDGGFIAHLGCGDARGTAALRLNEHCLVHGLDTNPEKIRNARAFLLEQGLQGEVSVGLWRGGRLPYADSLLNRIVVEEGFDVTETELLRVLAPRGILHLRSGETWTRRLKPYPKNMDEWTHFLHDASNNAVAHDTVVGPPEQLRWVAPPLWLRSHEIPSGIQNAVTGNGRIFFFFDEGLTGITDPRIPSRYALVARDAFNGRLLWKNKLDPWGWRQWASKDYADKDWTTTRSFRTKVPNENQRRMVADGNRLIVTLGYDAPLSILDAATGGLLKTVEETRGTSEVVIDRGIAVAVVGEHLVAFASDTGEVHWRTEVQGYGPTSLAARNGRVFCVATKGLVCLDQTTGRQTWSVPCNRVSNLVVIDGVVLMLSRMLEAFNVADGEKLWSIRSTRGVWGEDLFIAQGLVWQGAQLITNKGKPAHRSEDAKVVGLNPKTGKKEREIIVRKLVSPEHHHRCYRNKATERFIIISFEGAEFIDLTGKEHGQYNFLRGACRYGMMPANGLLYVPPDQCFCQPGAKLLGFAAVAARSKHPAPPVDDVERLLKGPAWGTAVSEERESRAWPTYRHDASRWGTTKANVGGDPRVTWRAPLKGPITAPVAASRKIFVAETDRHALHALEAATGKILWTHVSGGRIDSPPTIHSGLVLFGSRDGWVTCLRASDGAEVWRFLAAPHDHRIGAFGQLESSWPVHGNVLVSNGTAYVVAGRSTYLDGGIHLYALDPATGKILHRARVEGPQPEAGKNRHSAFHIPGGNSELLVTEGGHLYMRQMKFTQELEEVKISDLSSKGEKDMGLHVFSTSGLLDGSWYNRTFWMYSKRWPGFQLANQSPKSGQILVVDKENTYAVKAFTRRNVHSPMFFPGREGYLLFADPNANEPQIVGEEGARKPLAWLPQSSYERGRGRGTAKLDTPSFGKDKMVGYTRAEPPLWKTWLKVRVRALVKAGDRLYAAGPPDLFDPEDPYAPFEGKRGALLVTISAADGKRLSELPLEAPPVFDGLIAAYGGLFASLENGTLIRLNGK